MNRSDFIGVAPYAAVLVINAFLYYEALQIAPVNEGALGADFWPKAILVLAVATCVWEIVRRLAAGLGRNQRRLKGVVDQESLIPREKPAADTVELGRFVPWIAIALTAAYVLALPWLGYFVSTVLFVTAFVYLGNTRRASIAAGAGLAAGFVFMLLFMRIVYVSLPIGIGPFGQLSTLLMRAMGIK